MPKPTAPKSETVHVELTNGESAELRDPTALLVRERRPFDVAAAGLEVALGGAYLADGARVIEVAELALIVLLESWTLELPLPTVDDRDVLLDLTTADLDRLMLAVGPLIPQMHVSPSATKAQVNASAAKKGGSPKSDGRT